MKFEEGQAKYFQWLMAVMEFFPVFEELLNKFTLKKGAHAVFIHYATQEQCIVPRA